MDVFARYDDAYRRLVTEGLPLLKLGTPDQLAALQENYRVTKEATLVVADARQPPIDVEPDPSIVLRLKQTYQQTGSSNPPPGWNAQSLAYGSVLLFDYIPAYQAVLDQGVLPVVPADFVGTPTSLVEVSTGRAKATRSPIDQFWGTQNHSSSGKRLAPWKWPGAVLELAPGDYDHTRLSQPWSSADAVSVIRAAEKGTVFIHPHPVGGSDSWYFEWVALCRVMGLVFLPDDRAAVKTESPSSDRWSGRHPGFPDVEILDSNFGTGGQDQYSWNAETDGGYRDGKWLRHAYDVGATVEGRDFGWVIDGMCGRPDLGPDGIWDDTWDPQVGFPNATVWEGGVRKEHEGYDHSVLAPGQRIAYRRSRWGGRTFDQIVNRAGESQNSDGYALREFHEVEDYCLQMTGGGSIYTVKGHDGVAEYRDIVVRMGMNPNLHSSVSGNITGAFVCEFQRGIPCRDVRLSRWHLSRGKAFSGRGSARRPLISIQAAARWSLTEIVARQFTDQEGKDPSDVLSFGDPFGGRGMSNIGPGIIQRPGPNMHLEGDVRWGGSVFRDPGLSGAGFRAFVADIEANPSSYRIALVG